jgi:hypothetical protein
MPSGDAERAEDNIGGIYEVKIKLFLVCRFHLERS